MSPKDKARELVMKMFEINVDDYCAKQSALIAVDEVIEALRFHSWQNRNEINWWLDVKDEIKEYE